MYPTPFAPRTRAWKGTLGTSLRNVRFIPRKISYGKTRIYGHKTYQALPRVLVEEAHSDIERCSTPALDRVRVRECPARFLCDVDHIDSTESRGKQRLVGIAPHRVHDEHTGVLADGLRECLGALLDDDVTPAHFAGQGSVGRRPVRVFTVDKLGDDDLVLEAGLADLSLDGGAVDCKISKVGKELLGTVLALDELEEILGVVDELASTNVSCTTSSRRFFLTYRGPGLPTNEDVVSQETEQEWNVRLTEVSTFRTLHSPYCITHLYTTNTEFNESTEHFTPRNLVRRTTNGDLDKQRVVVRLERNNV